MRCVSIIALACVLLVTGPVAARMYEWVNPDSGRVQLSGSPPSWYRAVVSGPRVRVFGNGMLVDDTGIALSAEGNAALREFAVAKAAEQRQLEALRQLELAAAREAAARDEAVAEAERAAARTAPSGPTVPAATASAEQPAPSPAPEPLSPQLDAATIERLKALIGEFDRTATGQ